MKTTLEKAREKIAALDRAALETLALNVVCSLYLTTDDADETVIDSEKEWDAADCCQNVAADLENAGLTVAEIEKGQP